MSDATDKEPAPKWAKLILVGFVLLSLATFVGLRLVTDNQTRDCADRAEAREGVRVVAQTTRDIVNIAAPDYSKVPSYADLDPAMQAFLTEISSTARSSEVRTEANARLDKALAGLPLLEC